MLVNLRRRTWRVDDVAGGVMTATPLDDLSCPPQRFMLELEDPEAGAWPSTSHPARRVFK